MRMGSSRRLLSAFILAAASLLNLSLPGRAQTEPNSAKAVGGPRADAAAPKPSSPSAADPAKAILEHALDCERKYDWNAAISVYEDALEKWPSRSEFRHRLRLCEIHYRLNRRYQDQSFRNVLLGLNLEQSIQLVDEILERIELYYVEPVRHEPLLRRGIDNLEVALRDPSFIHAHLKGVSQDRLNEVRETLRNRRQRLLVPNRGEAERVVLDAYQLCRDRLGLAPAPVVLEFAFGACDALDDYTSYLTPDKLEDLYAMIDGNFVGLGVELKLDKDSLLILGVIKGGPAADVGVKTGERITQVNGQSIAGLSLDEAAARLQGESGTRLEITIQSRDGKSRKLALTRRAVDVESVPLARIVEPKSGVGYVQLTGFQKSSTNELQSAITRLQREGMRSLILDLRGNPGGLLNIAVEIADRFLDQGVIVTTRGRGTDQSGVYKAHGQAIWRMPTAVLVDHDSASASEILAGALKENRRAIVLGERSYGKGSVQSIYTLRTVPAGLKLTTAKFYSPLDRPYSEQGVSPDFPIRIAAKPKEGVSRFDQPELGDPSTDPVLEQAILIVRRELANQR